MNALQLKLNLFLRHYVGALHSFSRVPVRGALAEWADLQGEALRSGARHFPGVGWMVGMAACVVFAVVSLRLPESAFSPFVAAVIATLATVLITGGRHEDGLARFATGLNSPPAFAPAAAPATASFAVLALVLVLAAKFSLLALLGARSAAGVMTALLAGHAVSRFWPLLLAHGLPHVGATVPAGAQPLTEPVDRHDLLVAALWCVVPLLLMGFATGVAFPLLALAASGLAFYVVRQQAQARLGGYTNDAASASQQVTEAAFYLGAALALPA